MAIFPESGKGTLTVVRRSPDRFGDSATNPRPDSVKDEQGPARPVENRTAALVEREERGDRKLKDQYEALDGTSPEAVPPATAAETRKDAARLVVEAIRRTMAGCGK